MSPDSGNSSWTILRVAAGVCALPLAGFVLLTLVAQIRGGLDLLQAGLGSAVAAAATVCWGFALRGHRAESRARLRYALRGGMIVGGIGFAAGFVGPIIVTPEANQGPLLGIFVTGPMGFALGVALGALFSFLTPDRGSPPSWR